MKLKNIESPIQLTFSYLVPLGFVHISMIVKHYGIVVLKKNLKNLVEPSDTYNNFLAGTPFQGVFLLNKHLNTLLHLGLVHKSFML